MGLEHPIENLNYYFARRSADRAPVCWLMTAVALLCLIPAVSAKIVLEIYIIIAEVLWNLYSLSSSRNVIQGYVLFLPFNFILHIAEFLYVRRY